MFLKSSVHLKELADFLQENFSEYVFRTDAQLNLIEIITKKNAKKGKIETENVLVVGDDSKVSLMYFEHNDDILNIEKQAQTFMLKESQKGGLTMDKGKIMGHLQRKMNEKYNNTEVLERRGALALEVEGEVIAWFSNWSPDDYIMECGPELTEWALNSSILLEFYRAGRKLLKKPIKKYAIKVFSGYYSVHFVDRYLVFNRETSIPLISSDYSDSKWQAHFTKEEIEALKNRDDIAIDWDKVELEEVEDE